MHTPSTRRCMSSNLILLSTFSQNDVSKPLVNPPSTDFLACMSARSNKAMRWSKLNVSSFAHRRSANEQSTCAANPNRLRAAYNCAKRSRCLASSRVSAPPCCADVNALFVTKYGSNIAAGSDKSMASRLTAISSANTRCMKSCESAPDTR